MLPVAAQTPESGAMAHLFDARAYLDANPDAAEAVAAGRAASAWSHYTRLGFSEGRLGVPDPVQRKVAAVMEAAGRIPGPGLLERVHGRSDPEAFVRGGRRAALDLYGAVDRHLSLDLPLRILDFGCGCAQVLAFMAEVALMATFVAADADADALGWCRKSYREEEGRGHCRFLELGHPDETAITAGGFDLIYAMKAFTRMGADLEPAWLSELRRLARPDGILALATAGDPATRSRVDRDWPRYFTIVGRVPTGASGTEDLVVCQKGRALVI